MMTRLRTFIIVVTVLVSSPAVARADVVLDWNALAISTFIAQGQNPFAQARYAAITQLAVFEAVNAVTGEYEPYLGRTDATVAPAGSSAEAAAVAAAHAVITHYFPPADFPALAVTLAAARNASLATIPDGTAKTNGIAVGLAAAAAIVALRVNDGAAPPAFHTPSSQDPGVWQTTPTCPPAGGVLFHWQFVKPFGIPSAAAFRPGPPPSLTSNLYAKDYNEVKAVGSVSSTERPADRSDVARFYAAASPTYLFNLAARQIAGAEGHTLSENARALALLNMATSDGLVVSFHTKYHYDYWRPETAIRAGDADANRKTDADPGFTPYVATPCFPSYPSNHASGSNAAAELLRRLYGAGGHSLTLSLPSIPALSFHYTTFKQITNDVDDARVYGGIHFRFDQVAGGRLGREVATYVYKHNLRRVATSD